MPSIRVTGSCTAAPSDSSIFFPAGDEFPKTGRVVVTAAGHNLVLNAGVRADPGLGACVSGSVLHAAGGEDSEIEWRRGRWYDVYRYKRSRLWAASVALLASLASVALAIVSFTVNSSSTDTATRNTAVAVCVLTILNVVLTFAGGLDTKA